MFKSKEILKNVSVDPDNKDNKDNKDNNNNDVRRLEVVHELATLARYTGRLYPQCYTHTHRYNYHITQSESTITSTAATLSHYFAEKHCSKIAPTAI